MELKDAHVPKRANPPSPVVDTDDDVAMDVVLMACGCHVDACL